MPLSLLYICCTGATFLLCYFPLNTNLTDNLSNTGHVFRFAEDGEGNGGYLKADGSFAPFSKALSVLESVGTNVTFTAPKDGMYGFVSTQSNCASSQYGYPVITTTGEKIIEIQLTDTHANQYYGGWLHLMKMKKGDTFLAYKNTNGITPRCYVFY